MSYRLFTSESVTEGHPDKMADKISDSILDDLLRQDPTSRVAVETLLTTGQVHVAGEVTTEGYADVAALVRKVVLGIGYDSSTKGFDGESCGVSVSIGKQSPDIAQGVDDAIEQREGEAGDVLDQQGAGDQGLMFGYACTDTQALMPLPIYLAHQLSHRLARVRHENVLEYLRPDGKTQVTIEYDGDRAVRLDTVVLSTQHADGISLSGTLAPDIKKHVVDPVLEAIDLPSDGYRLLVNPTGKFVIGGPMGDAGLTGRKVIVDTYGGMARHGGGAFSGKDPSKVDRSAAYAMRWVAKNVVAAGLAQRCEVQVAYAIGKSHPVGMFVETFGTGKVPDAQIADAITSRVRPAARGHHPRPEPAAPDLRRDVQLRPLRPGTARLHLGAHRPGRRARGRSAGLIGTQAEPSPIGDAEAAPDQLALIGPRGGLLPRPGKRASGRVPGPICGGRPGAAGLAAAPARPPVRLPGAGGPRRIRAARREGAGAVRPTARSRAGCSGAPSGPSTPGRCAGSMRSSGRSRCSPRRACATSPGWPSTTPASART